MDFSKPTVRRVLKEVKIDEGMTYSCNDYYNRAADKLLADKCDNILTIPQAVELLVTKHNSSPKELFDNNSKVGHFGIGVLEELLVDPKNRTMHLIRPSSIKDSLNYKFGEKILEFHGFDLDYNLKKLDVEKHLQKLDKKNPEKINHVTLVGQPLLQTNNLSSGPEHYVEFMKWALGPKLSDPKNDFLYKSDVWYVRVSSVNEKIYSQKEFPVLRLAHVALEPAFKDSKIKQLTIRLYGTNNSHSPIGGILYNLRVSKSKK